MIKFLLLTSIIFLTACDEVVEITPNLADTAYRVSQIEVFDGTLNGEPTQFSFGPGQLTCNSADLLVYVFDTGAVYPETGPQATCETRVYNIFNGSEQDPLRPLITL